mgnify:CR=1 FL=1
MSLRSQESSVEIQHIQREDQSEDIQRYWIINTNVWIRVLEDDSGRHEEV